MSDPTLVQPGAPVRPTPPGAIDGGVFDGGPWKAAFFVEVPGRVSSKSNARRYRGSAKVSHTERAAARRQRAYADLVGMVVRAKLPRSWDLGPPPPAPVASRPTVACVLVAATTLDATNVPKTLLDACEGLVFHTDASVRAASQITVRRADDQRLLVGFALLAADADPVELAAATTELAGELARRF